jgi:ankyrin repeat protein
MCCLNYINATVPRLTSRQQELPQAKSAEAIALRTKTSTTFPFLEYAAAFILGHADDSAAEGISQNDFVRNFPRRAWIHTNNVFEKHQIRRYTDAAPLMYIYADRGLANLVYVAVQEGLPISSPDERYSCSIIAALQRDDLKVVKAFLSGENDHPQLEDRLRSLFNPQRFTRGDHSTQVLPSLLKNSRVDLLRTLLETRALDVNTSFASQYSSHSLLTYAIDNRSHECVKMLLDHGAKANMPARDGYQPPLCHAIEARDTQIINWLIDAGADVNYLDSKSWPYSEQSPLEVAITHGNQAIIEVLLAAGADMELIFGSTPNYALLDAVRKRREIPVELLLSAGANPNGVATNKDSKEAIRQEMPLHAAILRDSSKIVGLLLKYGADPNAGYPKDHTTILTFRYSDPLLDCSNDKLADHSPLYIAMACCGSKVLSCLIDAGATLNAHDSSNQMQVRSLIFYAFMEDRTELVKWLLQPGISGLDHKALSPLHSAIIDNEIRAVEWILRLVGDLTSTLSDGEF